MKKLLISVNNLLSRENRMNVIECGLIIVLVVLFAVYAFKAFG